MMNKCYLCGETSFKIFYKFQDNRYLQCNRCSLIFLEKIPDAHILHELYNKTYYTQDYAGRGGRAVFPAFFYRLPYFNSFFSRPGAILEIGAAGGDFLALMRERGWDVFGVELSAPAVRAAKSNYDLNIVCGTVQDAHFQNDAFDAVALFHVLEHLPDPLSVLHEARRVLKQNGYIVVEVPHPTGFDARLNKELLMSIIDYPNHLMLFPPPAIRYLFERAGFEMVLFDISFSYLIAQSIAHFKKLFIKKEETRHSGASLNTSDDVTRIASDNLKQHVKNAIKSIFSGMKIVVIARKKQ